MRRRVKEARPTPEWLVNAAAWVGERMWAGTRWLENRLARFTMSRLRWWFFCFLLFCTGVNTFVLIDVLVNPPRGIEYRSVSVPVSADPVHFHVDPAMVRRLRRYWDSVYRDPAMKKSIDSMSLVRPGFEDTIKRLREMKEE